MNIIKIGLLVPLGGPMSVWAPASIHSAILGAAEINAAGGLMGKEIELIIKDADWSPERAAEATCELVEDDEVSGVVAMIGSNARHAAASQSAGRCPFIYTPNYEQGSPEPDTIGISFTDERMIEPILDWFFEKHGHRRFFIIGSDYRWPLKTMPMTGAMIRAKGGSVEGMLARPIDASDDWDFAALEKVWATKPDLLLLFLIGNQAMTFHRNFYAAGLASKLPRCAIATDETVLASLDPDATEGLFAGASYFNSARTKANVNFMEKYWTAFGEFAPVPGFYGQSCYEGVRFAAAMIDAARTPNPQALIHEKPRKVAFQSARFNSQVADLSMRMPVYIARAEGNAFEVVAKC